jgi:hypothetical protein
LASIEKTSFQFGFFFSSSSSFLNILIQAMSLGLSFLRGKYSADGSILIITLVD